MYIDVHWASSTQEYDAYRLCQNVVDRVLSSLNSSHPEPTGERAYLPLIINIILNTNSRRSHCELATVRDSTAGSLKYSAGLLHLHSLNQILYVAAVKAGFNETSGSFWSLMPHQANRRRHPRPSIKLK